MKAVIAGAIVALLTGTFATAQDGTIAPAAGTVTLVQAGHLLDRPGQAPRGASTVVIRDGKVEAVREGFVGVEAFPGATVIDLRPSAGAMMPDMPMVGSAPRPPLEIELRAPKNYRHPRRPRCFGSQSTNHLLMRYLSRGKRGFNQGQPSLSSDKSQPKS